MTRRPDTPVTHRRKKATAESRPDTERVSLKPLTYTEAVRGLFAVKPGPDVETKDREEGGDGEDG